MQHGCTVVFVSWMLRHTSSGTKVDEYCSVVELMQMSVITVALCVAPFGLAWLQQFAQCWSSVATV
jgi:hypothetical protein